MDSSEFFKGYQVVKSPKKALKRPKKCPKKGSQLKSGLKVPPPPPLWTSPDFCLGELNYQFPYFLRSDIIVVFSNISNKISSVVLIIFHDQKKTQYFTEMKFSDEK